MQLRVELPSGPLIEFQGFCRAIAQTVCPLRERGLKGMECVVGKVAKHEVVTAPSADSLAWALRAGFQSVLLSADGRTLDQMVADQYNGAEPAEPELPLGKQVVEFLSPYPLDDNDRRVLEALLPQLPPLSYPMSDEAAAAFLDAYRDLSGRPAWEPVLMDAVYIERRRDEQMRVMEQHQRELREEFAAGRFVAVDRRHLRVKALMAGTYILREDAIAYLKERGLTGGDVDVALDVAPTERSIEPEPGVAPAAMPAKLDAVVQAAPNEAALPAPNVPESPKEAVPAADAEACSPAPSGVAIKKVGKVVRLAQVRALTGLSRSSIYNRMDERSPHYDPTFPRQFPLGLTVGSAVGWDAAEVETWVATQAERVPEPSPRRGKRSDTA
ncbi:AlpA family phage regulatory protein [Ralstonia sp. A12]|uniref:AlpA family phage regulatory protein n=1 Tax=Ralstonia sp. A12 TaxID=1217052 RepID=UPI0018DC9E4A|nr:AlpA family phage regulatory protein [Ralstonia sp. A12]